MLFAISAVLLLLRASTLNAEENCQLKPVIHVIKEPGCQPKPVPSFACHGTCASYVQVSGSKYWQVERSCMCCQEVGEREATRRVYCPDQNPKYRKVITRAPVECMCRPCSTPNEDDIVAQELSNMSKKLRRVAASAISNSFPWPGRKYPRTSCSHLEVSCCYCNH
ncbi:bursicon [Galendromus occidentalis]|uniref:Bursicon n=1 Tax=Galendromus occidentalis TaxID=34638 RepID=A0AAJ7P9K9_9ACAR|nr:bursicon [Galendromus occidentalis]